MMTRAPGRPRTIAGERKSIAVSRFPIQLRAEMEREARERGWSLAQTLRAALAWWLALPRAQRVRRGEEPGPVAVWYSVTTKELRDRIDSEAERLEGDTSDAVRWAVSSWLEADGDYL